MARWPRKNTADAATAIAALIRPEAMPLIEAGKRDDADEQWRGIGHGNEMAVDNEGDERRCYRQSGT